MRAIRQALSIIACLFALAPSAVSAQDQMQIEQITGNYAATVQSGVSNSATIEQRAILGRLGANNANVTQDGSGNNADVRQAGTKNDVALGQFGEGNSAQIGQYGFNLKTDVTQSGTGHGITVNQFGIGGGPIVVRQH